MAGRTVGRISLVELDHAQAEVARKVPAFGARIAGGAVGRQQGAGSAFVVAGSAGGSIPDSSIRTLAEPRRRIHSPGRRAGRAAGTIGAG